MAVSVHPSSPECWRRAGTSNYEPDKFGKPAKILTGIVLNSPILDYESNQGPKGLASNAGYLPTEALVADYYKKGTKRGTASIVQYVDTLRTFIKEKYNPARKIWFTPELGKAKTVYDRAVGEFDNLKTYWVNAAESRSWAARLKADAIAYGTDLANFLIDDAAGRKAFIDKFAIDPYTTLQDFSKAATDKFNVSLTPEWQLYATTGTGIAFFQDMTSITGLALDWLRAFELSERKFETSIAPDLSINPYDARINVPKDAYNITIYEDDAFAAGIKAALPSMFNYKTASKYMMMSDPAFDNWKYNRDSAMPYYTSSIPDLVQTLGYDPSVKMLVLHGYYDLVCPFHLTELDLANVGLTARVPVKNYAGGHMIYESEEARVPMKQELDKFYTQPAYPAPAATNTQSVSMN